MEVKILNIEDVIPYENNPRNNDAAVASVKESISQFGFKVPIVVDKDHIVITGHTRLRAASQLGLKEVPVIIADDLTEAQIKAYRIADNKTGEKATWDMSKLHEELLELDSMDFDMEGLGFESFELMALLNDAEPDGYDKDLIDQYSRDDDDLVKEGRIIITYANEEEAEFLKGLLKVDKLQVKNEAEKIMKRYE